MARPRKPANIQTGHTYSKSQLEEMSRLEEEMCSNDNIVDIVPEDLNDIAKIYYRYLIDNLKEQGNLLEKQNKNLQEKIKITEKEIAQNKYKMQNLKVAGKKAKISFNKYTLNYNIVVDNTVDSIDIQVQTEDSKSSVRGTGKKNLNIYLNTINATIDTA